ncbi:hypothetical protein OESDEN_10837 [Oesophagostomum dentatum]|uniref:Uncharacterized protein n=1 Tax=Oesophagostomum dentatum TaxID=61180 RepID=A0A0B1SVK3_OESDE|nr:hypothetical protein OESDEN_10837 [Oesophagostomum dentatum]
MGDGKMRVAELTMSEVKMSEAPRKRCPLFYIT